MDTKCHKCGGIGTGKDGGGKKGGRYGGKFSGKGVGKDGKGLSAK